MRDEVGRLLHIVVDLLSTGEPVTQRRMAEAMGASLGSTNRAIRLLKERGYLEVANDTLAPTESGLKAAGRI